MFDQATKVPNKHLLKNRKVVEEINRHLWIESERMGYDIGFNKAAEDWLVRFSKAWVRHHFPKRPPKARPNNNSKKNTPKRRAAPRRKTYSRKST